MWRPDAEPVDPDEAAVFDLRHTSLKQHLYRTLLMDRASRCTNQNVVNAQRDCRDAARRTHVT